MELDLFNVPPGLNLGRRYRAVSASHTTTVADDIIGVSGAGVTITLADVCKWPGFLVRIKDVGGVAGTSNITVTPASGNIDGVANFTFTGNYQSQDIWSDGSNWFVS